jgi:hypothetical protein
MLREYRTKDKGGLSPDAVGSGYIPDLIVTIEPDMLFGAGGRYPQELWGRTWQWLNENK